MTDLPTPARRRMQPVTWAPALFAGAIFASAGLLFLVQPMVTKLVLPALGGSPAVWNTSVCFFQIMLLVGYAYAHALQRIAAARTQALIHGGVLIAAALMLPLRLSDVLGPPDSNAPVLWLLGILTLSIGLPFAALSATAPLLQSWYARTRNREGGAPDPYPLYAASNLGSLIALLAYPTIVEPLLRLQAQSQIWSAGFLLFTALMAAIGFIAAGAPPASPRTSALRRTTWPERMTWIALAAAPSSLMLGVTTFLSTDVASAPFLWVAPLALYLITFIIAFQTKPLIASSRTFLFAAPALALCAFLLPTETMPFPLLMLLHLSFFFLMALACHVTLAAHRPEPARLTQFYLFLSLGGVIGGTFNALVAPVIFSTIAEYPLVLALICLSCALLDGPLTRLQAATLTLGIAATLLCLAPAHTSDFGLAAKFVLASVVAASFVMRQRAIGFFAVIIAVALIALVAVPRDAVVSSQRSFFGILRIREVALMRTLAHGTTLHGAQVLSGPDQCKPALYYAPPTPIGQVFTALQARQPALAIGAVGMGAGTVAAYTRAEDTLRFYEIDPNVVRVANDPALFTYIKGCARGAIDTVLGDARLSLIREPSARFDLLLIDAFSSDSIPVHLVTVEAMKLYLDRIKPDGLVVLHLSNRHLALIEPVSQVAEAAGGAVLVQRHLARNGDTVLDSDEDAIVVARDPAALDALRGSGEWTPPAQQSSAPVWSDDYVNLFGALVNRMTQKRR